MADGPLAPHDEPAPDSAAEVRSKAARGLLTVGIRSMLVRALGFAGTLIVAPLLGPGDFGVVALGLTVLVFGKFLADGGLIPGLIRRPDPPIWEELQAVAALQFAVTLTLVAITCAVGSQFGHDGLAVTLMVASTVIDAARVPTVVMAERDLDYKLLVRAEVLEVFVYNILAIGLVIGGAGVIGVAAATIAKSYCGTAVLIWFGPIGFVRPRWTVSLLRPIARFGIYFQAAWLSILARDEGMNLLLLSLGGKEALGAWALARRLMTIVETVFQSAWRVGLPGMARLMESGEPPRELLERAVSFAAVAAGYLIVPLVATAPALVPALFGAEWDSTAEALPYLGGGMMLAVPLGTVITALLWARDEAGKVFIMGIPAVLVSLGVCAALASSLGARGAGLGVAAGAVVYFLMSVYFASDVFGRAGCLRAILPTVAATGGAAGGWLVTEAIDPNWLAALVGGSVSVVAYSVLLLMVERAALLRIVGLARRTLLRGAAAATA
jgi:O-antigen/teichoic acid export membrane protein